MKQLFLLAAVICFGVAILKFYSARMGHSAPQAENPGPPLPAKRPRRGWMPTRTQFCWMYGRRRSTMADTSLARYVCLTRTFSPIPPFPLRRTRRFWYTAALAAAALRQQKSLQTWAIPTYPTSAVSKTGPRRNEFHSTSCGFAAHPFRSIHSASSSRGSGLPLEQPPLPAGGRWTRDGRRGMGKATPHGVAFFFLVG